MGKQGRSKKIDAVGKGQVTPIQIAYLVDRYLCDNNLSETRAVYRNEAASLISKSPANEAPKSLMSLGMILEEYISLKAQKIAVDQEKVRLEQERARVEKLLHGMQEVMNVYNAGSVPSAVPMVHASASKQFSAIPQPLAVTGGARVYKSSNVVHFPVGSNAKFSTPVGNLPLTRKRAGSVSHRVVEGPSAPKKSKLLPQTTPIPATFNQPGNASTDKEDAQCSSVVRSSSPNNCLPSTQVANGSSVVKSLFPQAQSSSPPPSSSGPVTPPQSTSSPNSKSGTPNGVSPAVHCSVSTSPENITPASCTVITSERVVVSPCKHIAYTVERNRCISSPSSLKLQNRVSPKRSGKRDCVKGRLDFGGSDEIVSVDEPRVDETSTPESEKDEDVFGLDLPTLFGPNFSFSELLNDLDLGCQGLECPCEPTSGASTDSASGTSQDGNQGTDQVLSEFSSTVTEMISGNDMHIQGSSDAPNTVTSITKSIRILSPAKGQVGSLEQQDK